MTQWHPIFAEVLRPSVTPHYELRTAVPVSDLPREADFVILRRKHAEPGPYRGLWRWLTVCNVLEFKGPTVSTRRADVELLVELGLGVGRRLHTNRDALRPRLPAAEMSFWYLANRLGRSMLREAARQLRNGEFLGPGLWRGEVLGHWVFLVSGVELPVEEDSLPLHIVGQEPREREREMVRLVGERPHLTKAYGGWLASLHPEAWKEFEIMARGKGKELVFDVRPAIEMLGLDRVIDQIGLDRVIDQIGLDRVVEEVGADRLIEKLGIKAVVQHIGLDRLLASLSPAERRELKRRLE